MIKGLLDFMSEMAICFAAEKTGKKEVGSDIDLCHVKVIPDRGKAVGSTIGQFFILPEEFCMCSSLTSSSMTSRRAHRYAGPLGSVLALRSAGHHQHIEAR